MTIVNLPEFVSVAGKKVMWVVGEINRTLSQRLPGFFPKQVKYSSTIWQEKDEDGYVDITWKVIFFGNGIRVVVEGCGQESDRFQHFSSYEAGKVVVSHKTRVERRVWIWDKEGGVRLRDARPLTCLGLGDVPRN